MAASDWAALAGVMDDQSKPDVAEQWYNEALAVFRAEGDRVGECFALVNLASLPLRSPGRLPRRCSTGCCTIQRSLPSKARATNSRTNAEPAC